MSQLPLIRKADDLSLWKSILDPLLAVKITQGNMLSATLALGQNQISHKLQRQPQGWFITDKSAASDIYRLSWDSNFLVLNASAPVNIGLWVF